MAISQLADLDFGGVSRIANLPDPIAAQQAATKHYVDSAVEGLAWKQSCRVASIAPIALTGPGTTIDGVTLALHDRILVKNQTSAVENGIYVWNGESEAMLRAADANGLAELEQAVVTIEEGSNAGATFRQTAVRGVIGTSAINWQSFGVAAPSASENSAGIAELATQAETDTGVDDSRIVTPMKLANWAGRKRKAVALVGDGTATSFNLDHNFATRDVAVEVYRNSGSYDSVLCDVSRPSVNRVTLGFRNAPGVSAFNVVVIG